MKSRRKISAKQTMAIFLSACVTLPLTPINVHAEETEAKSFLTAVGTGLFLSEGGFVNGNYEGYLSIALDDNDDDQFDRQCLIDKNGNILLSSEYTAYYYQVDDDVISYGPGSHRYLPENWDWSTAREPEFYHLDGSPLFEKVTVPEGIGLPPSVSESSPVITYSTPMTGGYAVVELEGYEGSVFMDKTGTVTYVFHKPEAYIPDLEGWTTSAHWFGDNGWTACREVIIDVVTGYKDGSGQDVLLFDPENDAQWFEYAFPFCDGLSVVGWGNENKDWEGSWGAVDTSGNLVIPQVYEILSNFGNSDGMFAVRQNGKWGYIDRNNQIVIPFIYDFAGEWRDGVGVVGVLESGKIKYGMVDRNNQLLLPCEYDALTGFRNGVAYGFKNSSTDKQLYLITQTEN